MALEYLWIPTPRCLVLISFAKSSFFIFRLVLDRIRMLRIFILARKQDLLPPYRSHMTTEHEEINDHNNQAHCGANP